MKELEDVYEYVAKLEEGYCSIIQESDAYSDQGDIVLMVARAKLYVGLAQLERLLLQKA